MKLIHALAGAGILVASTLSAAAPNANANISRPAGLDRAMTHMSTQGLAHQQATNHNPLARLSGKASPATPATPAVPATPATGTTPAIPATPAVPATPSRGHSGK